MNGLDSIEVPLKKICPVAGKLRKMSGYYSVLDCPDGKVRIYYRGKGHWAQTHMRESDDGICFSRPRVIWTHSFICHNFSPFLHEGRYYAVGGKKEDGSRMRPRVSHGEGLYLLQSEDGIHWHLAQENPILTPDQPGFHRSPPNVAEFDGAMSCVPLDGRFYLYFRANIAAEVRSVQYAVSDDLLSWSAVRTVRFDPEFDMNSGWNIYGPGFFSFEGKTLGFSACFQTGGEGFIGLFEPDEDMGTWTCRERFHHTKELSPIGKNHFFPVKGIIRNRQIPDCINYYIHTNYFMAHRNRPVTLDLYVKQNGSSPASLRWLPLRYPAILLLNLSGKFIRFIVNMRHFLRS